MDEEQKELMEKLLAAITEVVDMDVAWADKHDYFLKAKAEGNYKLEEFLSWFEDEDEEEEDGDDDE